MSASKVGQAGESAPNNTDKRLANLRPPWKPGESGNIKGRGVGSRNQLAESFLADLHAKWEEKGIAAIDKMADDDPGGFVRVVASLMPKELHLKDDLGDVSDNELAAFLDAARAALGVRQEGGEDAPDAHRPQQAKALQTLQ